MVRPLRELKGFQKVALRPGERRTLTFTLDQDAFAFYNQQLARVAEPGEFELLIGSASDDIRLTGKAELLP
ncbi:MAG: hypothetical protein EOO59_17445 [Hymenobacter sp.]|nr:MAG: hypothetical protein EOO59_17445 [Hymenobacter sp.]